MGCRRLSPQSFQQDLFQKFIGIAVTHGGFGKAALPGLSDAPGFFAGFYRFDIRGDGGPAFDETGPEAIHVEKGAVVEPTQLPAV